MTIFVTWQLRVTLDSIRNSCDVFVTCGMCSLSVWLNTQLSPHPQQIFCAIEGVGLWCSFFLPILLMFWYCWLILIGASLLFWPALAAGWAGWGTSVVLERSCRERRHPCIIDQNCSHLSFYGKSLPAAAVLESHITRVCGNHMVAGQSAGCFGAALYFGGTHVVWATNQQQQQQQQQQQRTLRGSPLLPVLPASTPAPTPTGCWMGVYSP